VPRRSLRALIINRRPLSSGNPARATALTRGGFNCLVASAISCMPIYDQQELETAALGFDPTRS